MAIRKVARLGHPVLRRVAEEVPLEAITSPPIRQLVLDMQQTMHEYGGVGLAAPQVHESIRLAVMELDAGDAETSDIRSLVIFNPTVTVLDETLAGNWEGCLSVPDMRGFVERPSKIRVEFWDHEAQRCSVEAEGFLATVFQHEFDHLNGIVYVDKLRDPTEFAFVQEFSRYHA